MVNAKNVKLLADFVEGEKYKFDMSQFKVKPLCGSAGCIGGHAAVLWDDVRQNYNDDAFTFDDEELADKLGISEEELNELCYPGNYEGKDRKMAVQTLRRLASTGKVVWE